ncbi:hypothetical protein L9F63_009985, partial [Diploptera punctata]
IPEYVAVVHDCCFFQTFLRQLRRESSVASTSRFLRVETCKCRKLLNFTVPGNSLMQSRTICVKCIFL